MEIIYKHKKTGRLVSLTDIKSKPDYTVEFHDKWIARYECIETIELPITYKYCLRDIPLSDSFEIIIEDDPYNFDIYEIHTLLQALELFPYITANEEKLKGKLINIIYQLEKRRD